jgi:hypothetical protein
VKTPSTTGHSAMDRDMRMIPEAEGKMATAFQLQRGY